jgi:hypothetical protein
MQFYFIILSIVLNTLLFVSAAPGYRYTLEADSQSNISPMSYGTLGAPNAAGTPGAPGAPGAPANDKPDKKPQDAPADLLNGAISTGRDTGASILANTGKLVSGS